MDNDGSSCRKCSTTSPRERERDGARILLSISYGSIEALRPSGPSRAARRPRREPSRPTARRRGEARSRRSSRQPRTSTSTLERLRGGSGPAHRHSASHAARAAIRLHWRSRSEPVGAREAFRNEAARVLARLLQCGLADSVPTRSLPASPLPTSGPHATHAPLHTCELYVRWNAV